MASMRDIKRRRTSITSTQQITKAMKLVSTVKLQKAKTRAEETTPYFSHTYETVCSILAKAGTVNHPYLTANDATKKAIITITSNRGLAGGYNSNVVKLITGSDFNREDVRIYAIGKKGEEALLHRGYEVAASYNDVMEAPTYIDARVICDNLLAQYARGEIGEIYLAYTHFKNTVVHVPTLLKLLPVEVDEEDIAEQKNSNLMMNFEPNEEEAISLIVPKYITSLI